MKFNLVDGIVFLHFNLPAAAFPAFTLPDFEARLQEAIDAALALAGLPYFIRVKLLGPNVPGDLKIYCSERNPPPEDWWL